MMQIIENRKRKVTKLLKFWKLVDQYFCLCTNIQHIILYGPRLEGDCRVFGRKNIGWRNIGDRFLPLTARRIDPQDHTLLITIPISVASSDWTKFSLSPT